MSRVQKVEQLERLIADTPVSTVCTSWATAPHRTHAPKMTLQLWRRTQRRLSQDRASLKSWNLHHGEVAFFASLIQTTKSLTSKCCAPCVSSLDGSLRLRCICEQLERNSHVQLTGDGSHCWVFCCALMYAVQLSLCGRQRPPPFAFWTDVSADDIFFLLKKKKEGAHSSNRRLLSMLHIFSCFFFFLEDVGVH